MNKLGTKNVQIQNLPQTESIDDGAMASLHSSRRNTTPSVPPKSYSDIWHMDIHIHLVVLAQVQNWYFVLVQGQNNIQRRQQNSRRQ